jgi:hypothetical protein
LTLSDSDEKNQKEDEEVALLIARLQSLGVLNLAREISDERFARRIVESQLILNSISSGMAAEEKLQNEIEERLLSLHSQLFDKAASYNSAIITLGYAGFFAIWSFVSTSLNPWDSKVVATLLGFSLLLFIGWTLTVAYVSAKQTSKIAIKNNGVYADRDQKIAAILEQENINNRSFMRLQSWWASVFIATVSTGFAAGIILLVTLLLNILEIDFSFHQIFFGP